MAHEERPVHRVQQREAVAPAVLRALAGANGRDRGAQVLHLGRPGGEAQRDRAGPRGVLRARARRRGITRGPRIGQVPRG